MSSLQGQDRTGLFILDVLIKYSRVFFLYYCDTIVIIACVFGLDQQELLL